MNNNSIIQISPNGGFSGQIARMTFFNSAMNSQMAKTQYQAGPVITTNFVSSIPNWIFYLAAVIIVLIVIYAVL